MTKLMKFLRHKLYVNYSSSIFMEIISKDNKLLINQSLRYIYYFFFLLFPFFRIYDELIKSFIRFDFYAKFFFMSSIDLRIWWHISGIDERKLFFFPPFPLFVIFSHVYTMDKKNRYTSFSILFVTCQEKLHYGFHIFLYIFYILITIIYNWINFTFDLCHCVLFFSSS